MKQIKDMNEKIEYLQMINNQLKEELNAANQRIKDSQGNNDEIKKEEDLYLKKENSSTEINYDIKEENEELKKINLTLQEKNDQLEEELNAANQQIKELQSHNDEMKKEEDLYLMKENSSTEINYDIKEENEELKKLNLTLQEKNDQLEEELNAAKQQIKDLQDNNDEMKKEEDLYLNKGKKFTQLIDDVKKENQTLKDKNDQLMKDQESLLYYNERLKQQCMLIQEENNNIMQENERLMIQNEYNQKQIEKFKNLKKHKCFDSSYNVFDASEMELFHGIEKIKRGDIFEVFEVTYTSTYALKIFDVEKTSGISHMRNIFHEYEVLNNLHHQNIIKTYGIFLGDANVKPSIVFEFCPHNLKSKIESLNENDSVSIILEICNAMKYVHKHGVIHRCLNLESILLDKDNHVKLNNFGMCTYCNEDSKPTQISNSLEFAAPEVISQKDDYDEKIDVYSFGVVMFAILIKCGDPKINTADVLRGKKAEIPSNLSDFSRELISKCWEFEPKDRPTFDEIFNRLNEEKDNIT